MRQAIFLARLRGRLAPAARWLPVFLGGMLALALVLSLSGCISIELPVDAAGNTAASPSAPAQTGATDTPQPDTSPPPPIPLPGPSMEITPQLGTIGTVITATGAGWLPDEAITLNVFDPRTPQVPVATYPLTAADDTGSFTVTIAIPADAPWIDLQAVLLSASASLTPTETSPQVPFVFVGESTEPTATPTSTPTSTPTPIPACHAGLHHRHRDHNGPQHPLRPEYGLSGDRGPGLGRFRGGARPEQRGSLDLRAHERWHAGLDHSLADRFRLRLHRGNHPGATAAAHHPTAAAYRPTAAHAHPHPALPELAGRILRQSRPDCPARPWCASIPRSISTGATARRRLACLHSISRSAGAACGPLPAAPIGSTRWSMMASRCSSTGCGHRRLEQRQPARSHRRHLALGRPAHRCRLLLSGGGHRVYPCVVGAVAAASPDVDQLP